jgi:hypothetical protein
VEKGTDPPQEAPLKTEVDSGEQERKGQGESGS